VSRRQRNQPTRILLRPAAAECSCGVTKQMATLCFARAASLYGTNRISDAGWPSCFTRSLCSSSTVVSASTLWMRNSGKKARRGFSKMLLDEAATSLRRVASSTVPQWISAAPDGNCTDRVTLTVRGSIMVFRWSRTGPDSPFAGISKTLRLSSFLRRCFPFFLMEEAGPMAAVAAAGFRFAEDAAGVDLAVDAAGTGTLVCAAGAEDVEGVRRATPA